MDTHAKTPETIKMQQQLRFFFDLALECNNTCISNYDGKFLTEGERECVENCYTKQMNWNEKFFNATK